jgi:hypothetical protein
MGKQITKQARKKEIQGTHRNTKFSVRLTFIVPLPLEVNILFSSDVKQAANTSSFTDSVYGCGKLP